MSTLPITLSSVMAQSYKNIEHILVDGGSTDETINILNEYKFKNKKIFSFKKKKLYESINYGIEKSTGHLIAILNSDDLYHNHNIIRDIVKIALNSEAKIFIGNTVYFDNKEFEEPVRFYDVKNFSINKLRYGFMPSHSASFVKKEIYSEIGLYNESMSIAADFDFFLRALYVNKKKFKIINRCISRMKTGGLSGKNFYSYFVSTKEIMTSFKNNKIETSILNILIRIPLKFNQFFLLNKEKLNKHFSIIPQNKYEKYFFDFRVIRSANNIDFKKNFILSALNLAYLGSFYNNEIPYNPDMLHWPDGVYSKKIKYDLTKVPGRDIIYKLKIPNNIKKIVVMGELSKISKQFLENKFQRKVIHYKLLFGSPHKIFNNIQNKKIKKSELVFLTLPTPKQEIVATMLSKKNNFFKIICIGGSINIASGEEKAVPKIIYNLEWFWRLRYETKRRLIRLIRTFKNYYIKRIFSQKFVNLSVKIID